MARYLSPAWFERLRDPDGDPGASSRAGADRGIVLRQLVTGTPEGTDVGYDVVVHGGRAVIRPAGTDTPSVTFTSDYTTATAVASGEMSTTAALAAGRLRVAGDVAALAALASELAGLDPLPADVRAETEWAP